MKKHAVRFVIDSEARFEESNGEPRPLTREEYAENGYRACPDHPRAGSKTLDATVSPNVVGCAVCGRTDYQDVSYDEYRAYYGNPEHHVYLGCIVDTQCECCQAWSTGHGLWNIDFMDDSPEMQAVEIGKRYTPDEARALPGYLSDVASDQLIEAE